MKLKKKFKYFFIFVLIVVLITIGLYLNKKGTVNTINYSNEVIESAKEKNVFEEMKGKNYSKVLEEMLLSNKFLKEYFNEYLEIDYYEKDNFLDNINLFLEKGYNSNEINNIYYYLSDKNINKLTNYEYYKLDEYYSYKNLNIDNIKRYASYKNNNNLDLANVITYVNIGLDKNDYEGAVKTENLNEINVLVNKYHYLESNYVPNDLISLSKFPSAKMVKEAAEAFNEMYEAYTNDGLTINVTTAYRWYSWQKTLYDSYVAKDGKEAADKYSARPGYSEHQTGLAVDLNDPNFNGGRMSDKDYEWMKENAYKYGFIIRYPENSSNLTGYNEEPWHLRYLGKELAKKVYDSKLTYDEYYDLYIEEY